MIIVIFQQHMMCGTRKISVTTKGLDSIAGQIKEAKSEILSQNQGDNLVSFCYYMYIHQITIITVQLKQYFDIFIGHL